MKKFGLENHTLLFVTGILSAPLLWYLVSDLLHLTNPIFLPNLSTVAGELQRSLHSGQLSENFMATLFRFSWGLIIGSGVGITLGILLGTVRGAYEILEFPLEFLRSMPVTAIFPLFLVIFGLGDQSKIAIAALPTALVMAISTYYGIVRAAPERRNAALVFGASPLQILSRVLVFECLPEIVVGFRLALSLALIVTVAGEMFIGTEVGVGQRIFDSYLIGSVEMMYAYLIVLGAFGYLMNKLFLITERRFIFWVSR